VKNKLHGSPAKDERPEEVTARPHAKRSKAERQAFKEVLDEPDKLSKYPSSYGNDKAPKKSPSQRPIFGPISNVGAPWLIAGAHIGINMDVPGELARLPGGSRERGGDVSAGVSVLGRRE
jgi:hypothetical protein